PTSGYVRTWVAPGRLARGLQPRGGPQSQRWAGRRHWKPYQPPHGADPRHPWRDEPRIPDAEGRPGCKQVTALERLRQLAATDPAVAPMAVLQIEALEEAANPAWERGVPDLGAGS